MHRGYNFGAGPAMLPLEVLQDAQDELLNWQDTGMSIMEIGHRTEEFMQLMKDAEQSLRTLLTIPDTYHVLFLGGAARLQFGMIPLNFIKKEQTAGYLITGIWSSLAYAEAKRIKNAYCIASGEHQSFRSVPAVTERFYQENSAYLYYTPNETINGVRCAIPPTSNNIPLIADMTSCLLAEPVNVTDFGLIFAGAQKNIANAGLTIVIVRNDLVAKIDDETITTMLDYRTHSSHKSLYATPPTFNCYIALKMFKWIESHGGVAGLYQQNVTKSKMLYDFIDASSFYKSHVATNDRSLLNICFTLANPALENLFLEKAKSSGLLALKGHRTVGGLRASLYNSMPVEGVTQLITFMEDFANESRKGGL